MVKFSSATLFGVRIGNSQNFMPKRCEKQKRKSHTPGGSSDIHMTVCTENDYLMDSGKGGSIAQKRSFRNDSIHSSHDQSEPTSRILEVFLLICDLLMFCSWLALSLSPLSERYLCSLLHTSVGLQALRPTGQRTHSLV